ncbi:MAG: GNAT family N-acetyltransferase [Jiangellaceae bacterium]|nr:GNAT family N-acetyltransferase [Jiangellaceae bacterium]
MGGRPPAAEDLSLRRSGVTVRQAGLDDIPIFRELRMAALRDSPDAFEMTYQEERTQTDQQWRERWASTDNAGFIASLHGAPVGIAAGYFSEPDTVQLVSMWVTPAARGRGVGSTLLDAVVQWAWRCSAQQVRLWVTVGNDDAERLYAGSGFERTGEVKPLRSRPGRHEIAMRLRRDAHQTRARRTSTRIEAE